MELFGLDVRAGELWPSLELEVFCPVQRLHLVGCTNCHWIEKKIKKKWGGGKKTFAAHSCSPKYT